MLRNRFYSNKVFFRGLIEFTNYCKNNCFYCGIRRGNEKAQRYRLTKHDILGCCRVGHKLGFRSFVLQGGEDDYYNDLMFCSIINSVKSEFPDSALTISFGEKSRQTYLDYFKAGADRYLLRHETASESHYEKLHPKELSLKNRVSCLYNLKDIGFQVGAGFMVGSPYQTVENLAEDLLFLMELQPHMVGIGPFIPHRHTAFKNHHSEFDVLNLTITMLALVRCALPMSLLPATTALASICENGRGLALKSGANVVMPNLSPFSSREKYSIYDNKAFTGSEAAESVEIISSKIRELGMSPCFERGDFYSCDE